MRMNRKGEGGFMEAAAVTMAVVVSLSAFLAVLPSAFDGDVKDETIPSGFLDGISVTDSGISFGTDIERTMSDGGFSAIRLTVRVIGTDRTYEFSSGDRSSDNMSYHSGTVLVSADGRKVNAEYELAVWK
jgi:hypothetical protein